MTGKKAVTLGILTLVLSLCFLGAFDIDFAGIEHLLKTSGYWAPILFSLLMIVGIVVSPIPTSPLTLMSSKLFGLWGGLFLSLLSATIGAVIAFFIARKLGDQFFLRFPRYRRFQCLLPSDATAFAIFLLRLPPSPTFDLVSYLAGLTPISVWQFVVATFLGMIPVTATLCWIGTIVPAVWLGPLLAAFVLFWLFRVMKAKKSNEAR